MKSFLLAALLGVPFSAYAQQPPLSQQLDSAVAAVNRTVVSMSNQIDADQAQIAQLRQQLAAANAEVEKMKKPTETAPAK